MHNQSRIDFFTGFTKFSFFFILSFSYLFAGINAAKLFTNHMVLQSGTRPIPIWGTGALPNSNVLVTLSDGSGRIIRSATSLADSQGKWRVSLNSLTSPKSEGMTLKIINDSQPAILISDVVVGDVWIFAGQSNVSMTVAHNDDTNESRPWTSQFDKTWRWDNYHQNESLHKNIRHFGIEKSLSSFPDSPQEEFSEYESEYLYSSKRENSWKRADLKDIEDDFNNENIAHFSALGYYFSEAYRDGKKPMDLPVGVIRAAWGGTPIESWLSSEILASRPDFREQCRKLESIDGTNMQNRPSRCFNAIISPLKDYPIRGVVWYQGESNVRDSGVYRAELIALIKSWRQQFKNTSLPFIIVQLPGIPRNVEGEPWALMRESQQDSVETIDRPEARVLLSSHLDLGRTNPISKQIENSVNFNTDMEIHPRTKKSLGERIALLVRRELDGESHLFSQGPRLFRGERSGNSIVLYYRTSAGGLSTLNGGHLCGFEVAGEDGLYKRAFTSINGNQIVLTSPEVAFPNSARSAGSNAGHSISERTKENQYPPIMNLSSISFTEVGKLTKLAYRLPAEPIYWNTKYICSLVLEDYLEDSFNSNPWDKKLHHRTSQLGASFFSNWESLKGKKIVSCKSPESGGREYISYRFVNPIKDFKISAYIGFSNSDTTPSAALRFNGRLSTDGVHWSEPYPFVEEGMTRENDPNILYRVTLRPFFEKQQPEYWKKALAEKPRFLRIEISNTPTTFIEKVEVWTSN